MLELTLAPSSVAACPGEDKQHLFASLIPGILDASAPLVNTLGLHHEDLDIFSQGYISGSDDAYCCYEDGTRMTTVDDLWRFLRQECSPQALKGEIAFAATTGLEMTPLAFRIGFLMGYLHTMVVLEQVTQKGAGDVSPVLH